MKPANDNFKTRVRRVVDKATGREVIFHDFEKRRPPSVKAFMKAMRTIADLHQDGMAAYFVVAFDNDMQPVSGTYIEDHVPISNSILIAAATEALRHRIFQDALDQVTDPDYTPCA